MTSVDLERALAFLDAQGRPVDAAWARATLDLGTAEAALAALEPYQNADGGCGHALEQDIAAPVSNPFAARLAMQMLVSLGVPADEPAAARLGEWLEAAQAEDGDWHFAPAVRDHDLAPWFAGWTFPSLNPACCVAGWARRLGLGSDRLFARVAHLFAEQASPAAVAEAEFYALLPYAEYVPWLDVPEREAYLDAIATRIRTVAEAGGYPDAGHFFEHAGPMGGPIAVRLPTALIGEQLDRLASEQEADGGWPSPYSPIWRSWGTAAALATLRDHGRI